MVHLTRIYHFNAGHRLYHPERDESWNTAIYGKCSHAGGHGHNFHLELTVGGPVDLDSGCLMPPRQLDELVGKLVLDSIDHRNLNEVLELSDAPVPTTEVLALEIWRRVVDAIPAPAKLERVLVRETEKNSFEVVGEPKRMRAPDELVSNQRRG